MRMGTSFLYVQSVSQEVFAKQECRLFCTQSLFENVLAGLIGA